MQGQNKSVEPHLRDAQMHLNKCKEWIEHLEQAIAHLSAVAKDCEKRINRMELIIDEKSKPPQ